MQAKKKKYAQKNGEVVLYHRQTTYVTFDFLFFLGGLDSSVSEAVATQQRSLTARGVTPGSGGCNVSFVPRGWYETCVVVPQWNWVRREEEKDQGRNLVQFGARAVQLNRRLPLHSHESAPEYGRCG